MIPSDLASRLRMMMQSSVQALAPVREIPADLPDLRPGQRFNAQVQNVLPDGTYRAVVAGKSLTLALQQGAKAGDALELTVLGRSGRSIVASQTPPASPAPAAASAADAGLPAADLSRAAKLLGPLLGGEDAAPPAATPLARGAPIAAQAPAAGKELAPLLQRAVAQSGLFYEAHQAQWIAGRLSTAALRAEPQARLPAAPLTGLILDAAPETSPRATPALPAPPAAPEPAAARDGRTGAASAQAPLAPPAFAPARQGGEVVSRAVQSFESAALATRPEAAAATTAAPTLPEEIAPLVRQQLEALANQQVQLLAQPWPGQTMAWQIEDAQREARGDGDEEAPAWTTSLRLALPRLGELGASLGIRDNQISIALRSGDADSAEALRAALPDLAAALESAGLKLGTVRVDHDSGGE